MKKAELIRIIEKVEEKEIETLVACVRDKVDQG